MKQKKTNLKSMLFKSPKNILVISGMHRSGTSMISGFINYQGLHLGEKFLQKDKYNPKGYFEDVDFVNFHSKVLQKLCANGVKGWPDWGFTEDYCFDTDKLDEFRNEALSIIKSKSDKDSWGWKDPRTSLLLDFWNELLPAARFILVYRNPWEVKKSIERLNFPVFNDNPDYAFKIWALYCRHLLKFYEKQSQKCLLVSANGFLYNPDLLLQKVSTKLGFNLKNTVSDTRFFSGDLFHTQPSYKEYKEFTANPEYVALLNELHEAADIPGEKKIFKDKELKVSVVIPCYNHGNFIEEAIHSVEKSLNKIYEIVIVNDGSTDPSTIQILKSLSAAGYQVIHQKNKGLGEARNAGIRAAKAPYILPLDSDNKIDPQYIVRAADILDKNPDVTVVYANPFVFGEKNYCKPVEDFNFPKLLAGNYIDACAIFRKVFNGKLIQYDTAMPEMGFEDWEIWIRLANEGAVFKHINEYLYYYRIRENSMITKCNQPEIRFRLVKYIVDKYHSLYQKEISILGYLHQHLTRMDMLLSTQENLNKQLQLHQKRLKDIIRQNEEQIVLKDNHIRNLEAIIGNTDEIIEKMEQEIDQSNSRRSVLESIIENSNDENNKLLLLKENHILNLENIIKDLRSDVGVRSEKGFRKIKGKFKKAIKKLFRKEEGIIKTKTWKKKKSRRVKSYTYLPEFDIPNIKEKIQSFKIKPLISVIIPVYNVDPQWLDLAVKSVENQFYTNWEICIADDCSSNKDTIRLLRELETRQGIKVAFLDENSNISVASNEALKLASGDYIAFLDHDDELTLDALYEAVRVINETGADFIYSDEDKLSMDGQFMSPLFKPDYSPDMFLSQNYICHLTIIKKSIVDETGGFRKGMEGSQDYDLFLRASEKAGKIVHIPRVLYHWRMIPGSTASRFSEKSYAQNAGQMALEDTLHRRKIKGTVENGKFPGTYYVKREISGNPLVSIIIPFKDMPELLDTCIGTILEKSSWKNFEIIGISNKSEEDETFRLMESLSKKDNRIKFYEYNIPFNYSGLNNYAATLAQGEHLVLLNNDIEIISPDWIEAMLGHSQREETGVVGGLLYYPDERIQHAGVIIGIGGVAGHSHKFFTRNTPGYFSRIYLVQNLSAVTGACLMVKKSVFEEVGGLNAKDLAIAFNDVDFCLRIREKGYLNVYTPYCEAFHHESISRGLETTPEKQARFQKEVEYMLKRHEVILRKGDPYYNLNLTLKEEDFSLKK